MSLHDINPPKHGSSPKITPQGPIGQCHVTVGPMFAGKTGHLNAELTRWADSTHYTVLRINYSKDIRDTTSIDHKSGITSHSSSFRGISDKIAIQTVSDLEEAHVDDYDVIGMDEAQFYTGIKKYVLRWLRDGKIIYVTGLDGFSNGELFGEITQLLPYATTFSKLTATCKFCMESSILRCAIMSASIKKRDGSVCVAGQNQYSAACFECHELHNID